MYYILQFDFTSHVLLASALWVTVYDSERYVCRKNRKDNRPENTIRMVFITACCASCLPALVKIKTFLCPLYTYIFLCLPVSHCHISSLCLSYSCQSPSVSCNPDGSFILCELGNPLAANHMVQSDI